MCLRKHSLTGPFSLRIMCYKFSHINTFSTPFSYLTTGTTSTARPEDSLDVVKNAFYCEGDRQQHFKYLSIDSSGVCLRGSKKESPCVY